MRKPIVGISLKIYMNQLVAVLEYTQQIKKLCQDINDIDLFMFPSMGTLREVGEVLSDSHIQFGAQNIAFTTQGALTGEFSIEALIEMGGSYVELGHAERRKYFGETNQMIHQKLCLVFAKNLRPVLCVGESLADKNNLNKCVTQQLMTALNHIPLEKITELIIAYEPVWAIGQAEAASADHVHQAHQQIRKILATQYGDQVAQAIRIMYGGSVSCENVAELVQHPDVDGVFVGRFGHNPQQFKQIIDKVRSVKG